MSRLICLCCTLIFLMFYSCHKNEETTVTKEIPPWLQLKVAALVPEPALCEITEITFIQYNGKNYFHVYCGIWSCMYCQLFDEQGNRPDWSNEVWQDFFTKKRDIQTVPACR